MENIEKESDKSNNTVKFEQYKIEDNAIIDTYSNRKYKTLEEIVAILNERTEKIKRNKEVLGDLWDLRVRDALNEFCMCYSPECDQYYGVCVFDDALRIIEELETKWEDVNEFFTIELLIPCDFFQIDEATEIKDYEKLHGILEYMGRWENDEKT